MTISVVPIGTGHIGHADDLGRTDAPRAEDDVLAAGR